LRSNAVVHLANAVGKIAAWEPPTRFNDTSRTYFEKLTNLSTPEDAARYRGLFDSTKAQAVRDYMAEHDPGEFSMLHTSISPNMIQAAYQRGKETALFRIQFHGSPDFTRSQGN
jgi:hypothetical protein